jgi:hypothetical protein
MSAKHTPGPWKAGGEGHGTVFAPIRGRGIQGVGLVAQAYGGAVVIEGQAEVCANARLIAAAPDMAALLLDLLEEAEDQQDVIDGNDGFPLPNDAMKRADKISTVLKKAGLA